MDEQVALFPMSRHSRVKEPDCSLDGARACDRASRGTASDSAEFTGHSEQS